MTRWLARSCGHKTDLKQLKCLKKCCTSPRCSFILKGISGPWPRTDLWALQVGTLASPAVFWRWNKPSEEWRERSNAWAGHAVTWASMRLEMRHKKKKKEKWGRFNVDVKKSRSDVSEGLVCSAAVTCSGICLQCGKRRWAWSSAVFVGVRWRSLPLRSLFV